MNEAVPTVVGVNVRVERADYGYLAAAVVAVVVIGTFLARTGGTADEAADPAPTAAEEDAADGLVRVRSEADADREWADARGTFRVECAEGRVVHLDARVEDLPANLRYGWRVIVGEENRETAPLSARPGVTATLRQGEGAGNAFRPDEDGGAAVRFTFANARRDVVVPLGLIVLDIRARDAFVLAAPPMTCRDA